MSKIKILDNFVRLCLLDLFLIFEDFSSIFYVNFEKFQTSKIKKKSVNIFKDLNLFFNFKFFSGGEILKQASLQGKIIDESGEAVTFAKLDNQKCPEDWKETIEKDLHRQFPEHEMFRKTGNGKQDLYRVLKAWVLYKPEIGYCQGQAPVASLLLMNLTGRSLTPFFYQGLDFCTYMIYHFKAEEFRNLHVFDFFQLLIKNIFKGRLKIRFHIGDV